MAHIPCKRLQAVTKYQSLFRKLCKFSRTLLPCNVINAGKCYANRDLNSEYASGGIGVYLGFNFLVYAGYCQGVVHLTDALIYIVSYINIAIIIHTNIGAF